MDNFPWQPLIFCTIGNECVLIRTSSGNPTPNSFIPESLISYFQCHFDHVFADIPQPTKVITTRLRVYTKIRDYYQFSQNICYIMYKYEFMIATSDKTLNRTRYIKQAEIHNSTGHNFDSSSNQLSGSELV